MLEFVLKFQHEAKPRMEYETIPSQAMKNPSWVLLQAGILEQIPAWDFGIFPCVCFTNSENSLIQNNFFKKEPTCSD